MSDGLKVLEHVDSPLLLRGCGPDEVHIPKKTKSSINRGELRRAILADTSDGPKQLFELNLDADSKANRKVLWMVRKAGFACRSSIDWELIHK